LYTETQCCNYQVLTVCPSPAVLQSDMSSQHVECPHLELICRKKDNLPASLEQKHITIFHFFYLKILSLIHVNFFGKTPFFRSSGFRYFFRQHPASNQRMKNRVSSSIEAKHTVITTNFSRQLRFFYSSTFTFSNLYGTMIHWCYDTLGLLYRKGEASGMQVLLQ